MALVTRKNVPEVFYLRMFRLAHPVRQARQRFALRRAESGFADAHYTAEGTGVRALRPAARARSSCRSRSSQAVGERRGPEFRGNLCGGESVSAREAPREERREQDVQPVAP